MANVLDILRSNALRRIVFVAIAVFLISIGLGCLLNGALNYLNWWGGIVFAPFAILIGVGLLLVVVFYPKSFFETTKTRSHIRGWPTGKGRYYSDRK